jgi:hypothetical protein
LSPFDIARIIRFVKTVTHLQHQHQHRFHIVPGVRVRVQCLRALAGLALLTGLSVAATLSAQTVVSIVNSGFEEAAAPGQLDPWYNPLGWSPQVAGTNAAFRWVSGTAGNEVHSGTRAFRISSPDAGTTQARIQQTNAARFAVDPGTTYSFSLWARGADLDLARDRFRVTIEWWKADGSGLVSSSNGALLSLSANDTWQSFSVASTATAPAGAATAKILIFFERDAPSESTAPMITFDDIVVTRPGSIPEPSTVALLCGAGVLASVCAIRATRSRRTR